MAHAIDIEMAARFCLEVAKAFGEGKCKLYDEEEFARPSTIIGAGGISGAEGSTTLVVEGEREEVEKILRVIESIKGAKTSGAGPSLEECEPWMGNCCDHISCLYIRSQVDGESPGGGKGDR
ncbi:MAG: DUF1177 family protein [Candidatus Bathyarchaeia archaeon]